MADRRIVCRFSCGAPSAVAAKLALAKYGRERVNIVYSDTNSEHPDNERFLRDCEKWFGKAVIVLRSHRYNDIWDVFERNRFITSPFGAPCTGELKKEPFIRQYQRNDDILVFGYTEEKSEQERASRLKAADTACEFWFPLIEAKLTKADCKAIILRAGIALPKMYDLGFRNNNCIGCPKGGMGYWNMIRKHFPEQFERMAELQRKLGPGSYFLTKDGVRISLDELDPSWGRHEDELDIECSVMCAIAEQDIGEAA